MGGLRWRKSPHLEIGRALDGGAERGDRDDDQVLGGAEERRGEARLERLQQLARRACGARA
eukprot:799847-Prymnesium_polylepis.1